MIDLFAALAACLTIKEVVQEKAEPVAPKDIRFNWSMYWDDVDKGMSATEQINKRQSGGYMTTAPLPISSPAIHGVVDVKRYQHDKRVYGDAIAEMNRQNGSYKYVRAV